MIPKTVAATFLALVPFFLFAQLPSGAIALYPLNNAASDVSGNGYDGALTATVTATNRFTAASNATGFTAGTSSGTLPGSLVTAMQNDFSIGYWFRTTMSASSSTQWYGGAAMVDAEVCGVTSDWGTALINGGAVAFGIGNPDITLISPAAGYNDGNWHFVTATRNASAGAITLYIDGAQVATTTGTATTARTAPTSIGLGRNVCVPTGVYTGTLDDAIAYTRTLSSTEVGNLYNYYTGIALPLTWLSFTGHASAHSVVLQWQVGQVTGNDHFGIEHSTNGINFNQIGVRSNNDNDPTHGQLTYQFIDPNPVAGENFYRVKQVDIDGHYTFSPVFEIHVSSAPSTTRLQSNPVRDAITLLNPGQQLISRLQVLDVSGRVILSQAPNSTNALITTDLQSIQPGYYLLRFGSATTTSTIAFIKLQ